MLRRNDGRCGLALALLACSCAAAAAASSPVPLSRPAVVLRRASSSSDGKLSRCVGALGGPQCLRLKGGGRLSMRSKDGEDAAMLEAEHEALKATLCKVISKNRPIAGQSTRCRHTLVVPNCLLFCCSALPCMMRVHCAKHCWIDVFYDL